MYMSPLIFKILSEKLPKNSHKASQKIVKSEKHTRYADDTVLLLKTTQELFENVDKTCSKYGIPTQQLNRFRLQKVATYSKIYKFVGSITNVTGDENSEIRRVIEIARIQVTLQTTKIHTDTEYSTSEDQGSKTSETQKKVFDESWIQDKRVIQNRDKQDQNSSDDMRNSIRETSLIFNFS